MTNTLSTECVISSDTVIFLESPLDVNHAVILKGSGGSVLDLSYKSTLLLRVLSAAPRSSRRCHLRVFGAFGSPTPSLYLA
jgi:hypothetical protein